MSWQDDDERDELDEEEDDGAEDEGGEPDELAGLDDDARAQVEAIIARREAAAVAARTAEWRAQFQERGFDLTPEGQPLIADSEKVAAFAGSLRPSPAKPPAAEGTAEEDPKPDRYVDPEAYDEWLVRQTEKRMEAKLEARLAELNPRLEQTEAWRVSESARAAEARVMQLLPGSPMADLASPERVDAFRQEFRNWLANTTEEQWRDDDNLLALAGACIAKVYKGSAQPRNAAGRFASPRGVNATAYTDSWEGHPDAGRAPRPGMPTDDEKRAMRQYGLTPSELVALSGETATIEDYRRAQKKAK